MKDIGFLANGYPNMTKIAQAWSSDCKTRGGYNELPHVQSIQKLFHKHVGVKDFHMALLVPGLVGSHNLLI